MKGIIFTELCTMVEEKFGLEVLQDVLDASDLPSNGVYTSVGTYDHKEVHEIVEKLGERLGVSGEELLKAYGQHVHNVFVQGYRGFFDRSENLFDFLESIEEIIHPEVKKLYHDAELPSFVSERRGDNVLVFQYLSTRNLSSFAEGLIVKSADYYKTKIKIESSDLKGELNGKRFVITIVE